MNRVTSASLLLLLPIALANADGLLSSLNDPKTVEQKEEVISMNKRELQELHERALMGAEVSVLFKSRASLTSHGRISNNIYSISTFCPLISPHLPPSSSIMWCSSCCSAHAKAARQTTVRK